MTTHTSSSREAYNEWHASHEVDGEADAPWHEMLKARLIEGEHLADRRVLEIGCGRGGFACWLARQVPAPRELVAADFSRAALDKAEIHSSARGIKGIRWIEADVQKLEHIQEDFDTIISCETIEHVAKPPLAIKQLARVLKPGGTLFLTTPNYLGSMGLYRIYCWLRGKAFDEGGQPICHVTMAPRTQYWVRQAGLRIIETDSVGQYMPFPGRPPIKLRFMESPHFIMKWFGLHSLVIAVKPNAFPT